MSETRNLICIGCPMGCSLTVTMQDGSVTSVAGNTCKRGDEYARREVISPTRVLTTTVPVVSGNRPTVPVKTAGEVPKAMVLDCACALRDVALKAPISAGDIILRDILGTGVDVIAVADVAAN